MQILIRNTWLVNIVPQLCDQCSYKKRCIQVTNTHADDDGWYYCVCTVCVSAHSWHISNVSQKSQQQQQQQRPNFCWSHNPPDISTTVGTWTCSILAQGLHEASCPDKAKHSLKKKKSTIIRAAAAAAAVTLPRSFELELDQDQRANNLSDCTVSGPDYLQRQQGRKFSNARSKINWIWEAFRFVEPNMALSH